MRRAVIGRMAVDAAARGHGYEQRGLAYLPVSPQYEGRFGRMFRLPPYVPSDARIAEVAALMKENVTGPTPELDNPDIPSGYTYLGQFIDHNPTIKMLALAFIVLVGVYLVADGFEVHIPKGYIYGAMAFSALVECLNLWAKRRAQRRLQPE